MFTSSVDDGDGCGAVQLRLLARVVADRSYPPGDDPPVTMTITAMAPSTATTAAMMSVTSSMMLGCGEAKGPRLNSPIHPSQGKRARPWRIVRLAPDERRPSPRPAAVTFVTTEHFTLQDAAHRRSPRRPAGRRCSSARLAGAGCPPADRYRRRRPHSVLRFRVHPVANAGLCRAGDL